MNHGSSPHGIIITTVVPATREETLVALCALWGQFNQELLHPEELVDRLLRSHCKALLAFDQSGAPLGFAAGSPFFSPLQSSATFELWALFIEQAWRRRGVGSKLLHEIHQLAHSLGCCDIRVSAKRDPAIQNFYTAVGYRPYACRLRRTL